MLDELLILKKIKEGDIKAFEELFRRYYFPLCCYSMYFGKKGCAYRFSSPLKAICTGRLAINLCSIVNTKKLGIDTVKQY